MNRLAVKEFRALLQGSRLLQGKWRDAALAACSTDEIGDVGALELLTEGLAIASPKKHLRLKRAEGYWMGLISDLSRVGSCFAATTAQGKARTLTQLKGF